jgi:C4-dicarboxylate transporter DctM subunit
MIVFLSLAFVVLLFAGVPVAYALAIAAAGTISLMPDLQNLVIAQKIFTAMDSFSLMAVPFFMLSGNIMNETGITVNLVKFSDSIVGHIKGGLGHSAVLTGVLMAGVSGSANADAAAIGSLMVSPLKKNGYEEGFACSLVASAAALGPIIPPSIMMIVYSGVTGLSIAKLFMGGVLPGLFLALCYMIFNYFYARRRTGDRKRFGGWRNIWEAFKKAAGALIMPGIILGGILAGVVTATEAGVVAALYGIAYGFITRTLNLRKLWNCCYDAAKATAVTMVIIAFATLLGYVLTRENFSSIVVSLLSSFTSSGFVVLLFIVALITFLGMFIDPNAILLMIVPVVAPLLTAFNFDPIHFSIVLILALVLGGLTPPVGLVLYIVASVDNTPLPKAVKAIWPFVGINLFVILMVMLFPVIATWIPSFL